MKNRPNGSDGSVSNASRWIAPASRSRSASAAVDSHSAVRLSMRAFSNQPGQPLVPSPRMIELIAGCASEVPNHHV